MTYTNTVEKSSKYFDFDKGIEANSTISVKLIKRTYNFVMWFFIRDSWMALLPRWAGTFILIWTILQLTGVIK